MTDPRAATLLALEEAAWVRLQEAFDAIGGDAFDQVGVTPEWSAKDVAHHIAFWQGDSIRTLERIRAGTWRPVDEDRDEIERINLVEGERSKRMGDDEVRGELTRSRVELRRQLAILAQVDDEAAEWFEEVAHVHYEDHLPDLLAFAQGHGGS